jgi:RNA polymerase sigma-70 factor (ECF subfamily)
VDAAAADDGVSTFINARSRILAAAFRTLGNTAEAEDVAQDVWLRWQNVDRDVVRNAPAFLTTTSRRLAINRAMGARTRYETPLELRLAEPVDPDDGPGILAERGQALESALQLLLEALSPMERAAYLLREAFNYSYRHIAKIVRVSEANSRQLVTRARKRLATGRRKPVADMELRRITGAFVDATQKGDFAGLEAILSADIRGRASPRAPGSQFRAPRGRRVSERAPAVG